MKQYEDDSETQLNIDQEQILYTNLIRASDLSNHPATLETQRID